MYLYDRPLSTMPFSHDEDPVLQLPPSYHSTNCISDLHWHNAIGSMGGLASGNFSGVRFARVQQQGKVIHSGTLDGGWVKVRSGERLEIEEMQKGVPISRIILPGFLAIEYKGDQAAITNWLQFGWFELTANIPGVANRAVFPGSLPSVIGGSPRPFTTDITNPQWFVDSASANDPFYDSASFAHRSRKSITIFDRPGMLIEKTVPTVFEQAKAKSGVDAESVIFAAHFDSYLVQKNVPIYHVPCVATIKFSYSERHQQKPPEYAVEGSVGSVTMLPEHLRTILHSDYPGHASLR